ncbi:hypothetical protein [Reinekea blandensis]|uniref:Lipoprotein n=1 Tax=Reinekea blandensis MED297 TaxID=314283 RepID=A4B8V3_9GAMM|nr:hypothetical protein [Reinekea blandensis]EAR11054.1 hypothetical protein MED297_19242 [Reinekea sp. MED297] [Reinekea blandensis MED297]
MKRWKPRKERDLRRTRDNALAWVAALSLSALSQAADVAVDSDKDGIADAIDNCVKHSNPIQLDADADGFGNRCDADFNNSGRVDKQDRQFLLTRLESRDPLTDLDEDGVTTKADLELLDRLMEQPPGPRGFTVNDSFRLAPPPMTQPQLFALNEPRENGSNAALITDFRDVEGLKDVVPINFGGQTIALNDLGILPDLKAGDGQFSAFLNFDFKAQQSVEHLFEKRLAEFEANTIQLFSGRSVSDLREFKPIPHDINPEPIKLPDGTVLRPFIPDFDFTLTLPIAHDATRSLMVNDLNVVADPSRTFDPCDVDGDGSLGNVNGAWSFKRLMTEMANTSNTGITAQEFTHNWILNWMSTQTVNTFDILPKAAMANFFDGWDGVNPSTLDMNNLPFRLLAIVNRIDLSSTNPYGSSGEPGEIRFVFGLVDTDSPSCTSGNTGATRAMTVIFEYGDVSSLCTAVKSRANQWLDLSTLAVGSPAYNDALQTITDDVTLANAVPGKPNGSALNQLRTNEIALGFPWQLREFRIDAGSASLASDTLKQTPDPAQFRSASLTTKDYMETEGDAISCESHTVPLTFAGDPFLGASADYGFGTIWTAHPTTNVVPGSGFCTEMPAAGTPTATGTVRHKLSLNTCDDCHAGETQTPFTHVSPNSAPATLSGFLTGTMVPDPVGEPVTREFDDLARRGQILEDLAVKSCRSGVFTPTPFDPIVHFPPIEPEFDFRAPEFDPERVDFSRLQQRSNAVH